MSIRHHLSVAEMIVQQFVCFVSQADGCSVVGNNEEQPSVANQPLPSAQLEGSQRPLGGCRKGRSGRRVMFSWTRSVTSWTRSVTVIGLAAEAVLPCVKAP